MRPARRGLRYASAFALFSLAYLSLGLAHSSDQKTPRWAYALNPSTTASASPDAHPPGDPTPLHVPNSPVSFTLEQTRDFFNVADWHPDSHPAPPAVVTVGRKPEVYACGYCHLPNGQGRPENSSLAGLPPAYIIQQLADFKSGARNTSEPHHLPAVSMIKVANAATLEEVQAAAAYFSSLRPKPWIRIVETKNVPKTHVDGWMLVPTSDSGREPIDHRIIEMAVNLERTELRDDASSFLAYVPFGSLAKGKSLVTTGNNGRTLPCSTCHGRQLRGLLNVPSIAGRSPSYIVRQLFDMQSGARHGSAAVQMQPVVAHVTLDDMIAIAAYLASLSP